MRPAPKSSSVRYPVRHGRDCTLGWAAKKSSMPGDLAFQSPGGKTSGDDMRIVWIVAIAPATSDSARAQ